MTDCYAVVEEGKDVISNAIQQIFNQKLCNEPYQQLEKTLVTKIQKILELHKEQWLRPCLPNVATLQGPCLELRIKIPKSKHLLRLIFWQHKDAFIIFSGHIIKPENYEDKQTTITTKQQYKEAIAKCGSISTDFFGSKKHTYQLIYHV